MKPERYKLKSISEVTENSVIISGLNQGQKMEIKDIRKYNKVDQISIISEYLDGDFEYYKHKILFFFNSPKYLNNEFQKEISGIFISAETLIKHKIKHPEIIAADYHKAVVYLQNELLVKKMMG